MRTPLVRKPAQVEPRFVSSVRPGLASLAALGSWLLLSVSCTGSIDSGNGTGNGTGKPPSSGVMPGMNGVLGTADIPNTPAKALSRLTNAQILHSAAALLGSAAVVGADALMPELALEGGFQNAGFLQELPLDVVKAFGDAAAYMVAHVTDWPSIYQHYAPCIVGTQVVTAAQQACMGTFILNFGESAFRRPTTMQDVAAFQPILDASIAAALTSDQTVQLLVQAFLQFPDFLYLFQDATLNDYQLASRLSYFVTDGPPDAPLYAAAKSGSLHGAGLATQVDRLLAMDMTAFARAFSYDYLELGVAPARDSTTPKATVQAFVSSATDTFAALINQNKPVSSIITTDTYVANPPTAAWITGQPSTATTVKATTNYPFVGLLTHPATLMAMSTTLLGSTVSRGQYVAYQLLCLPQTPPPPPGIQMTDLSAVLPPNPTERDEAVARANDKRCSACHAQFEAYSFGLNKWSGDGHFQTDPRLVDSGPIVTSLGNMAFSGYTDFLQQLGNAKQFERCVGDKLIQYGLQHTTYPADLLPKILDQSKSAGGVTFRAMMRSLVLQTIFSTR
jgi:Protein of unknown function (DUF1592)/Protein of unknown function (DUF1588)/Protein of unknown function (DUF1595)